MKRALAVVAVLLALGFLIGWDTTGEMVGSIISGFREFGHAVRENIHSAS